MAAKTWALTTPADHTKKNAVCDSIRDVKKHTQTAAGFYAEAQDTPDQTIAIYAGVVYFGTTKVEYAGLAVVDLGTSGGFETTALTADYYNKVLFTIDSAGTLAMTEGTEHAVAASVVAPAIPAGKYPICMVTVQDDGTATAGTILTIEQSEIQQLQGVNYIGGLDITTAYSIIERSQFTYSDADQITCGAAQYMCKDKYCYWVSTITTNATGAAGGAEWWYLYLDYSGITSGTAITATELIWSTTAPAWNTTYRQWMNGDDRCIFAVLTSAGNAITAFNHSGYLVEWQTQISEGDEVDYDLTWTDLDLKTSVPAFSTRAYLGFNVTMGTDSLVLSYRTNGQSTDDGHFVTKVALGTTPVMISGREVITDSAQIIELKHNRDDAGNTSTYAHGWFFPVGM